MLVRPLTLNYSPQSGSFVQNVPLTTVHRLAATKTRLHTTHGCKEPCYAHTPWCLSATSPLRVPCCPITRLINITVTLRPLCTKTLVMLTHYVTEKSIMKMDIPYIMLKSIPLHIKR